MAKRIPEKYISGGMLIGFIILMAFIGYGIWDGSVLVQRRIKLMITLSSESL